MFGAYDRNLSAIEHEFSVALHADGDALAIDGNSADVSNAAGVVERLLAAALDGAQLTTEDVALAAVDVRQKRETQAVPDTLIRTQRGREIRPRTPGQRAFTQAVQSRTLTFGIGPAGTGKTFLAVVMAVRALKARDVARVVLSRPAVDAGESLGFLPGDFKEKVDPYMRPLYDSLGELLDDTVVTKYLERGVIEVAPLAYMRGRTLSDAFVILDEAQNTTVDQLKMFLTRLGANSKMVVIGDATQIDLPAGVTSGLLDARRRFGEIDDVALVELGAEDVVRHPLVAKIVRAYERTAT